MMHRENDRPALITSYGLQQWWQENKRHRDGDLPARIEEDGTSTWYQFNQIHRTGDKPAIVRADGTLEWWLFDVHDRKNGPAVIHPDGREEFHIWRGSPRTHESFSSPRLSLQRADGTVES